MIRRDFGARVNRPAAIAGLAILAAALPTGCALYRRSQVEMAKQQTGALYYSDLGPEAIDVSDYPEEQRRNYAVYSRTCSRCHGLARSINSPIASREFWEMYILAMRRSSYYAAGIPISTAEVKANLDFLDFDSKFRKIGRKDLFDKQTQELKNRFESMINQRTGKAE